MSASACFQCNAIALYMCMHCFRYTEFLLGNKSSGPNAAVIMYLCGCYGGRKRQYYLCIDNIEPLKKYSSCFAPNTHPFYF